MESDYQKSIPTVPVQELKEDLKDKQDLQIWESTKQLSHREGWLGYLLRTLGLLDTPT